MISMVRLLKLAADRCLAVLSEQWRSCQTLSEAGSSEAIGSESDGKPEVSFGLPDSPGAGAWP